MPIIGLYVIYFYKGDIELKKWSKAVLLLLFLTNIIIHFSRTNLIFLCILILFSGVKSNIKKIFNIVCYILILFFIVKIIFPETYDNFIDKIIYSFNELSYSNETWTPTDIVRNWRGYEMYCEIQQFEQANIMEKIFGNGFGKTLDVFGYAYLVSEENSLAFLHNGYYTQLMIGGVIGVLLYIIWLIQLYFTGRKITAYYERNFLRGLAITILFTSYFVNGPFYSSSQAVILFYFGIIMGINYIENSTKGEQALGKY